mmetsp:Transcript_58154/g.108877  ORF Transcript_58154/g.108877 Transcript_58154/m.108877 type:complete len:144 (+) Transcript_58154:92-523(+)
MGARLGLGVGVGLGLGAFGACRELSETPYPDPPPIKSVSSTSFPLIPSGKLTLHTNHSLAHPALRHTDSWRQAFYVHHPDAQDDEETHEVSELMVFAATFALLHIAMCCVACGYWCLQMYRDANARQTVPGDGKWTDKRSKVS